LLHKELNVTIVDSQTEITPIQKRFLQYAAKHHEEEPPKPP